MKLKILVYEAEEGGYWAEVPALRGCVSEGETMDETLANIKEASLGWLETASEKHQQTEEAQLIEVEF
jgi:predicted RNase H-like HicB family nuclease